MGKKSEEREILVQEVRTGKKTAEEAAAGFSIEDRKFKETLEMIEKGREIVCEFLNNLEGKFGIQEGNAVRLVEKGKEGIIKTFIDGYLIDFIYDPTTRNLQSFDQELLTESHNSIFSDLQKKLGCWKEVVTCYKAGGECIKGIRCNLETTVTSFIEDNSEIKQKEKEVLLRAVKKYFKDSPIEGRVIDTSKYGPGNCKEFLEDLFGQRVQLEQRQIIHMDNNASYEQVFVTGYMKQDNAIKFIGSLRDTLFKETRNYHEIFGCQLTQKYRGNNTIIWFNSEKLAAFLAEQQKPRAIERGRYGLRQPAKISTIHYNTKKLLQDFTDTVIERPEGGIKMTGCVGNFVQTELARRKITQEHNRT